MGSGTSIAMLQSQDAQKRSLLGRSLLPQLLNFTTSHARTFSSESVTSTSNCRNHTRRALKMTTGCSIVSIEDPLIISLSTWSSHADNSSKGGMHQETHPGSFASSISTTTSHPAFSSPPFRRAPSYVSPPSQPPPDNVPALQYVSSNL